MSFGIRGNNPISRAAGASMANRPVELSELSTTFRDLVSSKLRLAPGVPQPKNADGSLKRQELLVTLGAPTRNQPRKEGGGASTLFTLSKKEIDKLDPSVRPFLMQQLNGPARTLRDGNVVGGGKIEVWAEWGLTELFTARLGANAKAANTDKGFLGLPFNKEAHTLNAKELAGLRKSLPAEIAPMWPELTKWMESPANWNSGTYLKNDLLPYFKSDPTLYYGPTPGKSPSRYLSDVRISSEGVTLVIPKSAPATVDYLGYGGGVIRKVPLEEAILHESRRNLSGQLGGDKANLRTIRA